MLEAETVLKLEEETEISILDFICFTNYDLKLYNGDINKLF